jgi:hypothetical protein
MYITVKYLGPTNHDRNRGPRYKAVIDQRADFKHKATVRYDYALDSEGNAAEAVRALVEKADLNKYGVWTSFIMAYGPLGYVAIPNGLGNVEHKTYLLAEEAA